MQRLKTILTLMILPSFLLLAQERESIGNLLEEQEEILEEGAQHQYYDQYPQIYFPISAHTITRISAYGDQLELEDGSLWSVQPQDGRKAMQWIGAHSLTQNKQWFSSYYYRLVNRSLNTSIEINLFEGPVINGSLTHYVVEFDFTRGLVTLTNPNLGNTNWEIHPADLSKFQTWDFTQPIPIILGDNSDYVGRGEYKWECILINIKQSKRYLRAHQY